MATDPCTSGSERSDSRFKDETVLSTDIRTTIRDQFAGGAATVNNIRRRSTALYMRALVVNEVCFELEVSRTDRHPLRWQLERWCRRSAWDSDTTSKAPGSLRECNDR